MSMAASLSGPHPPTLGKLQMNQNNQKKNFDRDGGLFGEKFGEKLFTASATSAAGIASSNLGAFDHAGENRDIYIYICNVHISCRWFVEPLLLCI